MRTGRYIAGCVIVLAIAGAALAERFIRPPEQDYPDSRWQTAFPYQRNVYWDFSQDPAGGPSPGGTPGAHYEGTDDPTLRESDIVTLGGAMQMYPTWPDTDRQGLIGIDNREGQTVLSGSITFHLDNYDRPFEEKHLWVEYELGGAGGGSWCHSVIAPGCQVTPVYNVLEDLPNDSLNWIRQYQGWLIQPNPPWEEITLSLSANPGGVIFADFYHVATECVPEPATLCLLALGGLALMRRKRK